MAPAGPRLAPPLKARSIFCLYLNVVFIDICCRLFIKLDVNIQALVDRRRVDGHQHRSVGLTQIVRVKHEAVRTVVSRVHEMQVSTIHPKADVIA